MASTLVPAIRARWPDAELGWVVGSGAAPLVRLMEGVDRVIEIDDGALLGGNRFSAVGALVSAWRTIGRGWDLALVAHTDARYALLSRVSGADTVRRFADGRAPRTLRWHGAEYLRLLSDGTPSADNGGELAPRFASLALDGLPDAPRIEGSGRLIVVAPGGGRNVLRDDHLRRWPIRSWEVVVADLVARGHRVVAVGGGSDRAEGKRCANAGAVDLTGQTSMLQLVALLRKADAVVTHDAGTLHLGLLLGTPIVALFGPTRPEERIPAWARATIVSRAAGLACAPCYDGRDYAACALNRCLSDAPAAAVLTAVDEQLANYR